MTDPVDLGALRRRLLDLSVSHLTHHDIDTAILPLIVEFTTARVAAATAEANLRDRWIRERLEDAYCGALGAHTGSDPNGLPPVLAAAQIRSILDDDPDVATMEVDTCDPLPALLPGQVRALVIDVVQRHDWAARGEAAVRHPDHRFDARCGVCRGDGQQIGQAVAFAYADLAETLPPETSPPGPTLSRLVSLVAEVTVYHDWAAAQEPRTSAAHIRHRYDGRCAVCLGDPDRLAAAVAAAYGALTRLAPAALPTGTSGA